MSLPATDSPFTAPLTTLQAGLRHRQVSPQAQECWRGLGMVALSALAMIVAGSWSAGFGQFLAAMLGTTAVVHTTRLVTVNCTWPRFWRISLLLTGVVTWIPGATGVGQVLFVIVAVAFLWLRRYRIYNELSSRRRAAVFLGATITLVALVLSSAPDDRPGVLGAVFVNVHQAARIFVALFASFTLATLFLHLRLHFLRLRPKLAVAGMLIAAVPVFLLTALAVVGLYGAIGGIRATQARSVLVDWLAIEADQGGTSRIFGAVLSSSAEDAALRERIADAITHTGHGPLPRAFFLREGDRMWAVRTTDVEGRIGFAGARRVTAETMERLARQIGCSVQFVGHSESETSIDLSGIQTGTRPLGSGDDVLLGRPSAATDSTAGRWYERWLLFGGATLDAFELDPEGLKPRKALLSLDTRIVDLWNTFAAGENEINQAVLAALLVVGLLFLVLQGLALYFGLRIAGGITMAVGTLHKATQRLARGDLSANIDLPNEDEFGDLADSFNEMTRAIRVAQEQLVLKQLLEQEIAMARQIQMRLLPHAMPELSGYQISGSSTPSKMVGGDYFDFLPLGARRLGVAIADVSGKGIPAALLMSNLQASLQGQAPHEGSVAAMVGRMNEQLARSTDDHMFATFFYAVLDADSGTLVGVNAGHDPALVVRADGSVQRLSSGGLLLGMLPGQIYRECEVTLQPGDVFVLYTDGITEAMGPGTRIPGMEIAPQLPRDVTRGSTPGGRDDRDDDDDDDDDYDDDVIVTNFFEEYRLRDLVVARRHESADAIRRAVLNAVEQHSQGVPQSDDITLVVIKRVAALPGVERAA